MNRPGKSGVVVLLFLSACGKRPDANVLEYLGLTVALGQREPDSIDYYFGPEEWVAEARAHPPALAEIEHSAEALARRLGSESRKSLSAQALALKVRASLAHGTKKSFDQEARELFGVETRSSDRRALEGVRRELDQLLPGPGVLAKRYSEFDGTFLIPQDRVPTVMDRAIEECRTRTRAHLPLPSGETVSIEYTADKPWNAYSSYRGKYHSRIQVNLDFGVTVDRALQLACHEGYPGHHAANVLVDEQLVQREHRWELLVQPTFSPQSFSSEALASYAGEAAFSDEERLSFEREVLFPLAGIRPERAELYSRVNRLMDQLQIVQADIARDYLDGTLEWSRAASALEDQALMVHPEATLKYLNEYRTYMLGYTLGKEMARDCFSRQSGDRWRLYRDLILGRIDLRDCSK